MLEVIYSLIFIEFLGILFFPIIFTVFWKLPDRGYSFSKLLALLIWVYIIWILGSFTLNLNLVITSSFILTILGIISLITLYCNYRYILSFIKKEYSMFLIFDLSFVIIFFTWIFIRNLDPSIYHTEQIMDFTILNSIMNYSYYPPQDLWFSGNPINYYYYGYLIFGVFFDYLHIDSSLAYNISVPLIAALSSIILFGLIWNITYCLNFSKKTIFFIATSTIIVFNFFSNLEPILEFFNSIQILPKEFLLWIAIDGLTYNSEGFTLFPNDHYWWWRATRVINTFDIVSNSSLDYTITEFPFFSFALADLHPHLISVPFYLMFLTLIFNFILLKDYTSILSNSKIVSNNIFFLIMSLTFGSLIVINTWNIPSILLLLFGSSLIPINNYFTLNTFHRFKISILVSLLGIFFFSPFYMNYKTPVTEIGVVGEISSRFIHIFTVWGLFIAIILIFLACIYINKKHYFVIKTLPNILLTISPIIFITIIWAFIISSLETINGNLILFIINKNVALLLLSISFIFLLYLLITKKQLSITLYQKHLTTNSINAFYFIITILVIGTLLIIIPEYIYIKDQFGNRMNTVFKFSFQSWMLFSTLTPLLIYSIGTYFKKYNVLFYICIIVITLLCVYYSFAFINMQINNWDKTFNLNVHKNFSVENRLTHDSIGWIKNHLPKGSIVLEAPGDSYSNFSKISSFSGHPTVLGWRGHQRQWRPFDLDEIFKREKDVENIYLSNNIDLVKELINQYEIKYIYIGVQENIMYGKENISKNTFRSFGKRIYQSEQMINGTYIFIYDVTLANE